jgi:hypothetical protein
MDSDESRGGTETIEVLVTSDTLEMHIPLCEALPTTFKQSP